MKEAKYYERLPDDNVRCTLCPVGCNISPGNLGRCRSRKNISGILYAINYGRVVSINPYDPVEKKPLYHFLPGSRVLSLGANYCNLHCNYCQNYEISQKTASTGELCKEDLVSLLEQYKIGSVAFTYTEPTIWYEFIYDTSKYLKNMGYNIILVTNGYINREPLEELLPYITAMNIDLKSIRNDFYVRNCLGTLAPVLQSIELVKDRCHLEITNLLITGENDSDEDINDLIEFVSEMDNRIPLHFSRYYPCYKLIKPATDIQRLYYAYTRAKEKLHHVYLGNIPFDNWLTCENCHTKIVKRSYNLPIEIDDGRCPLCNHKNYGVWQHKN
jgi:pyruvate formate lyase activating enzyme